MRFPLLAMLLLLAGPSLAAETYTTYKWKDDDGRIHYTQQPPNGRPYETIKNRIAPTDAAAAVKPAAPAAKTDANAPKDAAAKGEAEKDRRNCEIAQKNREALLHASKVKVTDQDGTERHLTEEERKEKLKMTDLQIENYCKK